MKKQTPILITGIPRSGTSMIAATINLCGAFSGEMSKRGRYSNDRIRESLVIPLLGAAGLDEDGYYPLPQELPQPVAWRRKITKILKEEGFEGGSWMYKDSRICLLWPVWANAYPKAKWIIVRRKTSDILDSCMKTGYMTRFKHLGIQEAVNVTNEKDGWLWMIHEYEKRFLEMATAGLDHKIIWPERMVQGDYQQLYELCDWLELPWKEESLCYINSLLWGTKQKERMVI